MLKNLIQQSLSRASSVISFEIMLTSNHIWNLYTLLKTDEHVFKFANNQE